MKEILLKKNEIVFVDDEDYKQINQYKWYVIKNGNNFYALRDIYLNNKRTTQYMHRFILDISKNVKIDHEDHNGLNNQKYNLRIATSQQNAFNSLKYKNNTSGYKGVSWCKYHKKWRVLIQKNKKLVHIGYFNDIIEAAKTYDKKAIEFFGEFAKLNFYKGEL